MAHYGLKFGDPSSSLLEAIKRGPMAGLDNDEDPGIALEMARAQGDGGGRRVIGTTEPGQGIAFNRPMNEPEPSADQQVGRRLATAELAMSSPSMFRKELTGQTGEPISTQGRSSSQGPAGTDWRRDVPSLESLEQMLRDPYTGALGREGKLKAMELHAGYMEGAARKQTLDSEAEFRRGEIDVRRGEQATKTAAQAFQQSQGVLNAIADEGAKTGKTPAQIRLLQIAKSQEPAFKAAAKTYEAAAGGQLPWLQAQSSIDRPISQVEDKGIASKFINDEKTAVEEAVLRAIGNSVGGLDSLKRLLAVKGEEWTRLNWPVIEGLLPGGSLGLKEELEPHGFGKFLSIPGAGISALSPWSQANLYTEAGQENIRRMRDLPVVEGWARQFGTDTVPARDFLRSIYNRRLTPATAAPVTRPAGGSSGTAPGGRIGIGMYK